MQSLKELYRIGRGPSSSHTIAPVRAIKYFTEEFGSFNRYEVDLYGSLSLTGKGHFTDKIIEETLAPAKVEIHFNNQWEEKHPNGMYIRGYDDNNACVALWTVFSLGGGAIEIKEKNLPCNQELYKENTLDEIKEVMKEKNISLYEYVCSYEEDIDDFLGGILNAMLASVRNGISQTGVMPGKLQIQKSAKSLNLQALSSQNETEKQTLQLMAYAYGACEENASGSVVVAAPTLGASGVLASLMYYYYNDVGVSRQKLIKSLAIAGIFGNLVKKNASISGAIGGCQAEVGTACSMASAACAYLNGLNFKQVEYAAEIGMEHNLGLTCDPVGGYVIIPCIERNAMAILRAYDAMILAKYMAKIKPNKVTFDMIVKTMNYTGQQIPIELKETSLGGLAAEFVNEQTKTPASTTSEKPKEEEIVLPQTEDDIELEDNLIFDDIVLDDNDEPTSPIKFKL